LTRSWFKFVIVGLILTLVSAARAESLVLIVIPTNDNIDYTPFENRLRSELTAAGFATLTDAEPEPVDAAALSARATSLSASMAVSIRISDGMVSGYVSIVGLGKDIVRPVLGYPIGEQAPSVFAVRATDVLHGALLELDHTANSVSPPEPDRTPSESHRVTGQTQASNQHKPDMPRATTRPDSSVESKSPPNKDGPSSSWGITMGSALGGGTHSVPLAPGGELGIYRQQKRWGASLEGLVFLPVKSVRLTDEARIGQWMVGGSIQLFQPLLGNLTLFESVAIGLYRLDVSGVSKNPQNERQPSSTFGYTGLGLGAISALNDETGLALRLTVVGPWRNTDIVIRDGVVASVAFPVLIGDLSLRLAF
jgi:hypothetical protein